MQSSRLDGALLAAKYAYMPNRLKYCGGDDNSEIFGYVTHRASDRGLKEMLMEFATMYPYLKLIAEANKIIDPFDYRVVEAYWLGNDLLNIVSMKDFYRHMADNQKIKKKLKPELAEKVFGKLNFGAKPHHSWHVLNIPKRTGHYPVDHTLETIDQCRISWGRIKNDRQSDELAEKITVEYQPLKMIDNRIAIGEIETRDVWIANDNRSFVDGLKAGEFVSIHWGWVCDKLTERQKNNLQMWTGHNLKLMNYE